MTPNRQKTLAKAEEIICVREEIYGNVQDNFARTAKMWSAYLNHPLSPHDVANLMCLLKISRVASGNPHEDNYIDICGYAAIASELVNP